MKDDNFRKEMTSKAKEILEIIKCLNNRGQDDNTINLTGEFKGNIARGFVSGSITSNIFNKNNRGE